MKTVYVVDDSALIRERLIEMLSGLRNTRIVGATGDPMEAMNEIGALHPDVVILDIELPRKSGIELMRDIRRAGIRTHVIILSNYAYPQYRKGSLEAGAEFFVGKVKDFDFLPSILSSLDPGAEHGRTLHEDPDAAPGPNEEKPP